MTGVGTTLAPRHNIGGLRENIDDLPFPFVAPLGPDYRSIRHGSSCIYLI